MTTLELMQEIYEMSLKCLLAAETKKVLEKQNQLKYVKGTQEPTDKTFSGQKWKFCNTKHLVTIQFRKNEYPFAYTEIKWIDYK